MCWKLTFGHYFINNFWMVGNSLIWSKYLEIRHSDLEFQEKFWIFSTQLMRVIVIWKMPQWVARNSDNALKCILVIYLCGHYLLITMLNLYNSAMICISPYYLSLHNFFNNMLFIVCNFLFSRNRVRKMSLQKFVKQCRPK